MPDVPGSGPTDPERLLEALRAAEVDWKDNHLQFGDVPKWPTLTRSVWDVGLAPDHKIDLPAFTFLRDAALYTPRVDPPVGTFYAANGVLCELVSDQRSGGLWVTARRAST
jgi:hypothetical protein